MTFYKKRTPKRSKKSYKPGSVLEHHLSSPYITVWLKPPPKSCGHSILFHGVASGGVYSLNKSPCLRGCSYHPFPSLPIARRFLSVALSLKSPSLAVSQHHCPVKPGLSSCEDFHLSPAMLCFSTVDYTKCLFLSQVFSKIKSTPTYAFSFSFSSKKTWRPATLPVEKHACKL